MANQQAVNSEIDEGQMTLIDHLTELRNRLVLHRQRFLSYFWSALPRGLAQQATALPIMSSCFCRRHWQKFLKKKAAVE